MQYEALFPFTPPMALGAPLDGVVSWNMNDTCNYRCTYCTQRFMPARSFRIEDVGPVVAGFEALPGRWEIKLSGGEPFRQPHLEDIVGGLVGLGHVVSVQTNFSASDAALAAFLDAAGASLHVFSASLHLDYDAAQAFVARYQRVVAPRLPRGARFHVTSVATPERLPELRDVVGPTLREAGITLKVQPEKVKGHVREYGEAEAAALLALGGHNQTGQIAHDFQGRLCQAGARYLVIKSDGQVWRCYPGSRYGGRYARLGTLTGGFALVDGPRPCPYTYCNCTVPIDRGMVMGVAARPSPEPPCTSDTSTPAPAVSSR